MKPILYILVGVPGSGKSTFANKFIQDYDDTRLVSRDDIRFAILRPQDSYFSREDEVFKKFADTITQTLVDGFDVIADATHLNYSSRRKLTCAIDKYYTDYVIKYLVFDTDLKTCIERNSKRQGRAQVPPDVITDMYYHSFEPPTMKEDKRIIDIEVIEDE